jgi:hypothetical protein
MRPIAHHVASLRARRRLAMRLTPWSAAKPAWVRFTGRVLAGNANSSRSRDDFLLEQTRGSLLRPTSRRSALKPAT